MYKTLALQDFPLLENAATEVSSVALGGKALSCSDEWFAPASDLLKVGPAPSLKGQFGPKGALFDGWETRRHNPEPTDWVIIRLGPKGGATVVGLDVDTANFNGNEAPEVEVFGFRMPAEEEAAGTPLLHTDTRWEPILPRVPCGPSQRHLYSVDYKGVITHVKLNMIPDGGIARFRVYGNIPPPPIGLGVGESQQSDPRMNSLDLAHSMNGGQVVFTSDQHFGKGSNVILPGRGHDMGDGWETKRSRTPGHKDWLVIKLGEPGFLDYCEIDTAHFLGNYPASVELHGIDSDAEVPPGSEVADGDSQAGWIQLLERQKTGPGKQHFYKFASGVERQRFSHIRVTMHPDGGIKRVRIIGRRAAPLANHTEPLPPLALPGFTDKALPIEPAAASALESISQAATAAYNAVTSKSGSPSSSSSSLCVVKAVPLTTASFSPYGQVIAGPSSSQTEWTHAIVNQGTARKYAHQAQIQQSFPQDAQPTTNMHLYRCDSLPLSSLPFPLKMLERHLFSSQSFVPIHSPPHQGQYLVVVAQNGQDDKPDLDTLRVLIATGQQAICYLPGVWHLPMTPIGSGGPLDYACIVAESTSQPELNCDEVWWGEPTVAISL